MGQQVSLGQAWAALGPHWQECFELAWRSLRSGGIAIGALLVDGDGDMVGRGRNRRFGASGGGSAEISGLLGHAEMNALVSVPAGKARSRDYVLYTTLQPCPMCTGAIVLARLRRVEFAAVDPRWAGPSGGWFGERMAELSPAIRERWPAFEGPLYGPLGVWADILPCLSVFGSMQRSLEATAPARAALARATASRFRDCDAMPPTTLAALEVIWDELAEASAG
jgi:tRNA(Arg) A34 adenosine deaminase TadA